MNLAKNQGNGKYYLLRPTTIYNWSPMFTFTDRKLPLSNRDTMLFSMPMFAKYNELPSVRVLPYERLVLKMMPGVTSEA